MPLPQSNKIYADYAATTPLDGGVLRLITPYFSGCFGNPSSQHSFGRAAAGAVTSARDEMAVALGISPDELIFTSGGTEADNLAVKGIAMANSQRGRHIVCSAIEHPAVIQSVNALKAQGFEVSFVNAGGDGIITPQAISGAIRQDTVLVCVMSANNETGVIQPIPQIYDIVKSKGAYLFCDCVQSAGVLPMSLFPADAHSLSAHKFYGPKGAGALHVARGVRFTPQQNGGHQERGLRGGTINTPAVVGMARALSLSLEGAGQEASRLAALRDMFEELVLSSLEGVEVNGRYSQRLPSHSNMSFWGCDGQNIVMLMDMQGVACSTGAACSAGATTPSHVLTAMGLGEERVRSAVRFSFGRFTTQTEVELAVQALCRVVKTIRG